MSWLKVAAFAVCVICACSLAYMGEMTRCAFVFLLAIGNLFGILNDMDNGRFA